MKPFELYQKRYDADTQTVAQAAQRLQQDQPDLSWGECIRLAEKWLKEREW